MISIKPHHFVDIITQLGCGERDFEPHPYGHAQHDVARQLLDDRETMLCIEIGLDAICEPCRHNVQGECGDTIDIAFRPTAPKSKHQYNQIIDHRWCEHLGMQQGDRMTAREFCERLRDRAGCLADIYRETPVERTRERQARLQRGIDYYLHYQTCR